MIYTLTLNPAIDYVVGVDDFKEGQLNKTNRENIYAGGKGINVSTVLRNLGLESVALGFVAGKTGEMLTAMLREDGLKTDFVNATSGMTRINIKLSNKGKETEINGMGPVITNEDIDRLYEQLSAITDDDILIMSGSIPASMSRSTYTDICSFLRKRNCSAEIIIDSSSKEMLDALKYNPLLIKPNHHELGNLFGVEITTPKQAAEYGNKLKEMGAKNVLVSMGAKGAVLIDEKGDIHEVTAPKGQVINSVGAGDTTVSAFVSKYLQAGQNKDYDTIVRYCVAAGSATAFSEGLADNMMIEEVLKSM